MYSIGLFQASGASVGAGAEYRGILLGLRKARALGATRIVIKSDSQLIAGHVDKTFQARHTHLAKYLEEIRKTEALFKGISIRSIPRADNQLADILAKAAAEALDVPKGAFYEELVNPSIHQPPYAELFCIPITNWRSPILDFLQNNSSPLEGPELQRRQGPGIISLSTECCIKLESVLLYSDTSHNLKAKIYFGKSMKACAVSI
ncbi:hypothetical protein GUJ93_ZPchr0013g36829 [Zizania palustris]|uniref:RNase H type-1 domain-containing protein n=1 Tax=Zizania palustris TaxID=103762 RepID=A0A8J5WYQ2_ZIZPA|nr:hypothetical protein GUJ93_ZPchr0013g36829 [Zizania palustris]